MIDVQVPEPSKKELKNNEETAKNIMPMIVDVPELPDLPTDDTIPRAALAVLTLRNLGWTQRQIADLFGWKETSAIAYYQRRYDPEKKFCLNVHQIRAYTLAQMRSRKLLAVMSITKNDIEGMNAKDRTAIALNLQKIEHFMSTTEVDNPESRGATLIKALQDEI